MKKPRRKPGHVTHNRYELLPMNIKAAYSTAPSITSFNRFNLSMAGL